MPADHIRTYYIVMPAVTVLNYMFVLVGHKHDSDSLFTVSISPLITIVGWHAWIDGNTTNSPLQTNLAAGPPCRLATPYW